MCVYLKLCVYEYVCINACVYMCVVNRGICLRMCCVLRDICSCVLCTEGYVFVCVVNRGICLRMCCIQRDMCSYLFSFENTKQLKNSQILDFTLTFILYYSIFFKLDETKLEKLEQPVTSFSSPFFQI